MKSLNNPSCHKIGFPTKDDNCIANISPKFGEFGRKNGRVIAQRIGPICPARLLFRWALDRGAGPWGAL